MGRSARWQTAHCGSLRVLLDELAHGQALGRGFVVGQPRHVLGRARQLLAEQHFADPVAAQDRAGARGAGLLGQRRRLSRGCRRAPYFFTPSTRRHSAPVTPGMP